MAEMHSQSYHIDITNSMTTIMISTLQIAEMHSQHYPINIKLGCMAMQYYHINIINGWNAQPVLFHGYHMNTQSRFYQKLGHTAILNVLSQPTGMAYFEALLH